LRHTFVSHSKAPLGKIKDRVGHSVQMDTRKVYGRELNGEKDESTEILNEIFKDLEETFEPEFVQRKN